MNIRACPFCGKKDGEMHGVKLHWVQCPDCGASGPVRKILEEALYDWNKRAEYAHKEITDP